MDVFPAYLGILLCSVTKTEASFNHYEYLLS